MNWRRGFNRLALVFGAIGVAGGFYVGTLQDAVVAERQAISIQDRKRTEIRLNPEVIATVRDALIKANLDPDNPGQLLKPPAPKPTAPAPPAQGRAVDFFAKGGLSTPDGSDIFAPSKADLERRRDQIESQIIESLLPPLSEPPRDLARWLEILKLTAIFGLVGWLPFRLMGWIVAGFAR